MRTMNKSLSTSGSLVLGLLTMCGLVCLWFMQPDMYIFLPMFIAQVVVTWPFSLMSKTGQRWWALYIGFVACLLGAIYLGPNSKASWLLILISWICLLSGIHLRWNPPAGLDQDGRPLPD